MAGNFHFAPGKSMERMGNHIHDLAAFPGYSFNLSHEIHGMSFGSEYPGIALIIIITLIALITLTTPRCGEPPGWRGSLRYDARPGKKEQDNGRARSHRSEFDRGPAVPNGGGRAPLAYRRHVQLLRQGGALITLVTLIALMTLITLVTLITRIP